MKEKKAEEGIKLIKNRETLKNANEQYETKKPKKQMENKQKQETKN